MEWEDFVMAHTYQLDLTTMLPVLDDHQDAYLPQGFSSLA